MNWLRRRRFEVLELKNRGGSIEHFYHFFLAALVPLANHLATTPRKDLYFLRSCGPMNRYLLGLNLDNLVLVDKATLPRLAAHFSMTTLNGYDAPPHYDQAVFMRSRAFLLDHTGAGGLRAEWEAMVPKGVVVIDRGAGDPYYNSQVAEIKLSGNERRSIPNIEEVAGAIRKTGEDVTVFKLEAAPLEEQVRVFGGARVVVLQHGAAISDVMWMKPGTTMIQINPGPDWADTGKLASMFDVRHQSVVQASPHAPADVAAVLAALPRP